MPSLFSNMAFIWWFKAFNKPQENPIIKWWVENNFPDDFLAFLDDNPFFKGVPISEKDVLFAWMTIGFVQFGHENKEQFMKRCNKEYPPVTRKRKILALAMIPVLLGLLYAMELFAGGGLSLFFIIAPIIGATVVAALDYHYLYHRLICGRKVSIWSPLVAFFLKGFIVAAFMFSVPMLLMFAGIDIIYYMDISSYPIILRMLLQVTSFLISMLGMLFVFEIYSRVSLRLIQKKLAM
jgi:hypothetical protein